MGDHLIENLDRRFATVATDLRNGHEIWFTKGDLWNSVRASFAMPGLLKPVNIHDRWVVDGALVNPVPVSVCRALGADIIIAVNLNSDVVGRHMETPYNDTQEETSKTMALDNVPPGWRDKMSLSLSGLMGSDKEGTPGLLNVMATSINIMQDRITRSRLAGEPADVLLAPRLGKIGLLEFSRAEEAIEEGRECVRRNLPQLQHTLDMQGSL
jgi:NTE family protein